METEAIINTTVSSGGVINTTVSTGTSITSTVTAGGVLPGPNEVTSSTATNFTGLLKGNGTTVALALGGTDYQVPITLTTTGTSGAATFSGGTLNIPNYSSSSYTLPTASATVLGGVKIDGTTVTISSGVISAAGFASPMTSVGDTIVGGSSGMPTRLAGNTTTTKKYLAQTGTGGGSATPAWTQPAATDLSNGTTGTGSIVLATSPALTTPNLGTPSAINLTNGTVLPIAGISATGTPSSTTYLRGDGTWSTVSGGGAVSSVANSDGSLTVTPTTGTVVASLNPAHANTWSANQNFSAGKLLDAGEIVFDVIAYGAAGNGTTDDTTAIQNAINACNTAGGGKVWLPWGTYKITAALKLYSGTTPTIVAYSNITLAGAGASGTHGTIIAQATTGLDVIKGLNDVANGAQSTNVTIQDMCLTFTGTATNSGNGLYMAQQAAGGPSFQQWTIKNVVAQNMQATGKYGFNTESAIVTTFMDCMAVSCANGFNLNGAAGGAYDAVSTSVTYINCYANMATNGVIGFNCQDNTYISYLSCAVDIGANMTGEAYNIGGSSSISFYACGCELDGTHTLTDMWKIGADSGSNGSSQVGLYNCYGFQSKTCIDVYVTGSSTGITIVGFQDNSSISGSTGLKVDAGSVTTELDTSWGGVATARTISGTNTILNDSTGKMSVGGLVSLTKGSDTSGIAAVTTPTFTTGTYKQLSTSTDAMLYITVTTASTLALTLSSTSSGGTAVFASATYGIGCYSVRVPKSWYVDIVFTSADVSFKAVSC